MAMLYHHHRKRLQVQLHQSANAQGQIEMTEYRVWNGTAGWVARPADEVPSNSNGSFVGFYTASSAQDAIAQAQREHPEIEW